MRMFLSLLVVDSSVFELDTIKNYTTIAHCLCLLISKFRVRLFRLACLLAEFNVSHLVTITLSGIDFDRCCCYYFLVTQRNLPGAPFERAIPVRCNQKKRVLSSSSSFSFRSLSNRAVALYNKLTGTPN